MSSWRGSLQPAHRGYQYQDIATAYELVLALVERYESVIVDRKQVPSSPSLSIAVFEFIGWEAMRKCRHLLEGRFLPWTHKKGLNNLRQVPVDALRQFRQSWTDSPHKQARTLPSSRRCCRRRPRGAVLPTVDRAEPAVE